MVYYCDFGKRLKSELVDSMLTLRFHWFFEETDLGASVTQVTFWTITKAT